MPPSAEEAQDRSWEAGCAAVALLVRLGLALKFGDRFHQIDELGYDVSAWQLASQGVLGTDGVPRALPLVPNAFFAFFYRLFGHQLLFPRLGQAFVGAAVAWMLGRMTRELTGSRTAGRVAAAVAAIYPFFVYYSCTLLSETLYIAALVPGLWLLCASLGERGGSLWRPAAAGAALALAALSRPEGAPIAVLIWAAAAAMCRAGRWSWRSWLLAVLCWALPLTAMGLRNKAALGDARLDTHGGMAMLHGTILFELNEQDTGIAMEKLKEMPFYQKSLSLPESARDKDHLRAALRFMLENPGLTLRQWGRKLVNFWRFYPRVDKAYHETEHSHPGAGLSRWMLVVISLLFEPALIVGGFIGLWSLRRRWTELFPLGLFLLGTMGIHMVSVSQMRYRLPVMPVLILGFAYMVSELLERRSSARP